MLKLKIECSGKTFRDLELALDEVKRLVAQEYLSGFNSNDTGRFTFDITGEEETAARVHHDAQGWYIVAEDEEEPEDGSSLGFDGRPHYPTREEALEHA